MYPIFIILTGKHEKNKTKQNKTKQKKNVFFPRKLQIFLGGGEIDIIFHMITTVFFFFFWIKRAMLSLNSCLGLVPFQITASEA